MVILPDALFTAGGAAFGVGLMWVIKNLPLTRNGNGKLSKSDHAELCGQVQKRLDAGDIQFRDLTKKIDDVKDDIIYVVLNKRKRHV